jgi:hypothetical protein
LKDDLAIFFAADLDLPEIELSTVQQKPLAARTVAPDIPC